MGIDVYLPKRKGLIAMANNNDWALLQQQVATCQQCTLHQNRIQTVFGAGNIDADWLLIGEAPGFQENQQGQPFVGHSGQLLNNMLYALGLSREQIFITNILKCRPPKNRDPQPEEIQACANYLKQQIDRIQPKIILAIGRIAAQNLIKTEATMGEIRGKPYRYGDTEIVIVATYHPSYLLRTPQAKKKTWLDLQLAMRIYQDIQTNKL
ncbi:Uracil-DNA glycosylase, family 4 [uncultured Candidatus Thioglobus sp.]|nr:Uracil-DNA glycosylase, family 4 [uncultured Candidatus Thioglobus sp.]